MPNNYTDIANKISKLRSNLPILIGNEVVNFALDNFAKQGFDKGAGLNKWADRGGRSGIDPRPGGNILVGKQSGRLRRSIRRTRTTKTSVTVGSDEEYAGIHNEGGTITVKITAKSRRYFWAMYYENGGGKKGKEDPKEAVYWKWMALTKKNVMKIKMPERRFLGPSKALNKRIIQLIEREVTKCFT